MKKYKSNHMFTVMFQICNEFLAVIPGIIIAWVWFRPDEAKQAVYIMFPSCILLILFFVILGNVIHFLISLFTKYKVYLDKDAITVTGTGSMKLDDIRFIIFDQGQLPTFGSRDCSIQLFNADDSESLEIQNPSFLMIRSLCKRCKKAKFKFKNYKFYIIICGCSTVFSIVLCSLA
ncbi:MAG: hypothetical protein IKM34_05835 [Clostridia bacterium]|nr:hypothetical protein [Clostridia bacterium]